MKYSYIAQTNAGIRQEGFVDAPDRFAAAQLVREKGLIPVATREVRTALSVDDVFNRVFGKVKLQEKILFTRNLAGMLKAGLALSRALEVLEKQTTNTFLQKVLRGISHDIAEGGSLSFGMAKFPKVFSTLFISMVRAGEESGSVPESLIEVGQHLERTYTLNRKIKSALMYPLIIMCAIVLIAILMFIFVVPTITKTFIDLGVELPTSTKLIITISNMFANHTLLVLGGLAVFGFLMYMVVRIKTVHNALDLLYTKMPLIGELVRQINAARTARTLASLLASGVEITKALSITADVLQNVHYKKILIETEEAVKKGSPMSASFRAHPKLFPIMVGEMIAVGEETGKLADMLVSVATFFEEEVDTKTKSLSTIIEPLLMIVIGGAVGFFAVAMITPMYSLLDAI
jgi:type IV pilus assembly protein PilC